MTAEISEQEDTIEKYGVWVTSDPVDAESFSLKSNDDDDEVLTVSDLNLQETADDDAFGISASIRQPEDSPAQHSEESGDRISALERALTSLKQDMADLKESISTIQQTMHSEETKKETEKPAAFFADDDADETIALNVNELENILTTSEVTELEVKKDTDPVEELEDPLTAKTPNSTPMHIDFESASNDILMVDSSSDSDIFPESSNVDNEEENESIILPESELENVVTSAESEEISEEKDFSVPIPSELGIEDSEANEMSNLVTLRDSNNITQQLASAGTELKQEITSTVKLLKHILQTLPEQKIKEYENLDQFSSYQRLSESLSIH